MITKLLKSGTHTSSSWLTYFPTLTVLAVFDITVDKCLYTCASVSKHIHNNKSMFGNLNRPCFYQNSDKYCVKYPIVHDHTLMQVSIS